MNGRIDPEMLEGGARAPGEPVTEQVRHPKFEPALDQPEQITLGTSFPCKNGSTGYNVKHNGEEKVWFVKGVQAKDLEGYPEGQQLIVCLRRKDENSWPCLSIQQAIFEDGGSQPVVDPTIERRKKMTERYAECLEDATLVLDAWTEIPESELRASLVKDIATTFFIERTKKNW